MHFKGTRRSYLLHVSRYLKNWIKFLEIFSWSASRHCSNLLPAWIAVRSQFVRWMSLLDERRKLHGNVLLLRHRPVQWRDGHNNHGNNDIHNSIYAFFIGSVVDFFTGVNDRCCDIIVGLRRQVAP